MYSTIDNFTFNYKKTNGDIINYISLTKTKGKNAMLKEGWNQCQNNNYYVKDDKIVHWNRIMKVYILEVLNERKTSGYRCECCSF